MTVDNKMTLQFKPLEARPGNLNSIFEKNMMLARNKIAGNNIFGYNGNEVVKSAIPSFEANSLRASLAPPEPLRRTEEEIAEEKRKLEEIEFKRQEIIRIARENEERRKAEEAEKERLRLAEIARKEAEVQAKWDAAYNKIKINLAPVEFHATQWNTMANEMFEHTRQSLSQATGFLPPRLSDSQAGFAGGMSPYAEHFKEALSPRRESPVKVEVAAVPTDLVVDENVVQTEAVVVESVAEPVTEELVEEERVPTLEVEQVETQYTQAEPVITAEEVVVAPVATEEVVAEEVVAVVAETGVSPVSVTTQERSSPMQMKPAVVAAAAVVVEEKQEGAPTTATTSLDVEAEESEKKLEAEEKAEVNEVEEKTQQKTGKGKGKKSNKKWKPRY